MTKVLSITYIELRSPWLYFSLSLSGMTIVKSIKSLGCLGWKSTGFWTSHYTMTLWESADALPKFVRDHAHRTAMGKSKKLATEIRIITIPSEQMLPWRDAKALVRSQGRVFNL